MDNLFSIECGELDDLVAVLEEGLKNRAIGTHNMNDHSSRSHTILTVHIHSEEKASSEDNNVRILQLITTFYSFLFRVCSSPDMGR